MLVSQIHKKIVRDGVFSFTNACVINRSRSVKKKKGNPGASQWIMAADTPPVKTEVKCTKTFRMS